MKLSRIFGLLNWYLYAKYLPKSTYPIIGPISKKIRYLCAKLIFKETGTNVNLENLAYFGNGKELCIGNHSGIGMRCRIPSNIRIGNFVMMAEEVAIFNRYHKVDNLEIPMAIQGHLKKSQLIIGDDVWIGSRVIILPQVSRIGNGVIIGAGSVVTKNIEDYSVVAGNPAKLIKKRK